MYKMYVFIHSQRDFCCVRVKRIGGGESNSIHMMCGIYRDKRVRDELGDV